MLSIPDMAILGAVALLMFGPEQLPRVARKAGNVMREIQNTSQSFIREMERAADVQDAAARTEPPPYEASAYDPLPYHGASDEHAVDDEPAPSYDATPYSVEAAAESHNGARHPAPDYEPPAPDPEAPIRRNPSSSAAAQAAPEADHPANL